jgi:transposase-like protein
MVKKVYKRYSESFRIQVVREYEAGASIRQLQRKYGIKGATTVQKWLKKYSTEGLRCELMTIQTPEERDRLKELQAENARLKALVADLYLEKAILESTVAVIERDYGIDVKKNDLTSSNGRRK